jgi:hypothetical protein
MTAAALAGCAGILTADAERLRLSSPQFRSYVERVFREQNSVADALAFAIEGAPEPPERLVASEQALLVACSGINELATAQRDARRLGLRRSLALARGVPECERAARAAAAVLRGA